MRRYLAGLSILGMLLLLMLGSTPAYAQRTCRGEIANRKGVARADITIIGGAVTIADANASRCALWIRNNGSETMRCSDVTNDAAPTATAGIQFAAGEERTIENSATGQWQCFPVSTSTTANVSESMP